jgi:hypothetical protein
VPRPRGHDLLLLTAVGALVLAAGVDAVLRHRDPGRAALAEQPPSTRPTTTSAPPATAPRLVALRGSPETAFLPDCRRGLTVSIEGSTPRLVLHRSGGRCHLPPLRFEAIVRDGLGTLRYRGPALGRIGFEGRNLAGPVTVSAPLLPGVLRCDVQAPLRVAVHSSGLAASGAIRCRGSP